MLLTKDNITEFFPKPGEKGWLINQTPVEILYVHFSHNENPKSCHVLVLPYGEIAPQVVDFSFLSYNPIVKDSHVWASVYLSPVSTLPFAIYDNFASYDKMIDSIADSNYSDDAIGYIHFYVDNEGFPQAEFTLFKD